jgi:hypothetical protein
MSSMGYIFALLFNRRSIPPFRRPSQIFLCRHQRPIWSRRTKRFQVILGSNGCLTRTMILLFTLFHLFANRRDYPMTLTGTFLHWIKEVTSAYMLQIIIVMAKYRSQLSPTSTPRLMFLMPTSVEHGIWLMPRDPSSSIKTQPCISFISSIIDIVGPESPTQYLRV